MQLFAIGGLTEAGDAWLVFVVVVFLIYFANDEAKKATYRRRLRERELEAQTTRACA